MRSPFILIFASLALVACNEPMKDYVDVTVSIKAEELAQATSEARHVGDITISRTHSEPYSDTECDTEVCGYDRDYQCRSVPRCGYVNGQYVCEGSHQECDWVETPRYCERNCRQVTRYRTHTNSYNSRLIAKLSGMPAGASLSELTLGYDTNDAFRAAKADPSQQPDEYKQLFQSLRSTDKTLLVLKAKGAALVANDSFLRVPESFRLGDDLRLDVKVRAVSGDENVLSATGTSKQMPR